MIWRLPPGDSDFSTRWSAIKGCFTRSYLAAGRHEARTSWGKQRDSRRGVWQAKFFEHTIRDEDDFIKHVEYIHYNPVKHGLASAPFEWQHSSFHEYVSRGMYEIHWSSAMPFDRMEAPHLNYEGAE
jgi:putative transposase